MERSKMPTRISCDRSGTHSKRSKVAITVCSSNQITRTRSSTVSSGTKSVAVNSIKANTSASVKAAARFGFRRLTIQSWTEKDSLTKSSNLQPTSRTLKYRDADYRSQIDAISKSQAVIEFGLDGVIQNANANFLQTLGYTFDEIKGRHHRMFVDSAYANSIEYRNFWEKLNRGEFDTGEYRRIGKGGREVWISASYNPIFDLAGRPVKVVKYASDVSAQKLKDQELQALSKTQAVINFQPRWHDHRRERQLCFDDGLPP